jgi:hypothetical protein
MLTSLGIKYNTDKVSHRFLEHYEKHFHDFKKDKFNLLEIGVFFGSSIKMWDEYFVNANIYGVDTFEGKQGNGNIFPNADKYYKEWECSSQDKIHLVKLDQSSKSQLENYKNTCINENLNFKIILDDGSHLMYDQQISFYNLFPLVEPGGYYVIEDIHTSEQSGYDVNEHNSTKQIFLDIKNNNVPFKSPYITEEEECNKLSNDIDTIELCYNSPNSQILIIKKKV